MILQFVQFNENKCCPIMRQMRLFNTNLINIKVNKGFRYNFVRREQTKSLSYIIPLV